MTYALGEVVWSRVFSVSDRTKRSLAGQNSLSPSLSLSLSPIYVPLFSKPKKGSPRFNLHIYADLSSSLLIMGGRDSGFQLSSRYGNKRQEGCSQLFSLMSLYLACD